MQIQSFNTNSRNNPISKPSFQGIKPEQLFDIIPNTKICKNLTNIDKYAFQYYVKCLPFKTGVTKEEFAMLNKLDGADFIVNAYELLTKKLKLNPELRPPLFCMDTPLDVLMAYSPYTNILCINTRNIESILTNKTKLFSIIRHELQHYLQNMQIMRHETIGEKAIDICQNQYKQALKLGISEYLEKGKSTQELINAGMFKTQEEIELYENCARAFENNDTETFDKLIDVHSESYRSQLKNFRNNVINAYGLIKKDSNLTPKIQQYLDDYSAIGYYNPNGSINLTKYINTSIEAEAIQAEGMAEIEHSGMCGTKKLKESLLEIVQNKELMEKLNSGN